MLREPEASTLLVTSALRELTPTSMVANTGIHYELPRAREATTSMKFSLIVAPKSLLLA